MSRIARRPLAAALLAVAALAPISLASSAQAADAKKPAYTVSVRDSKLGSILTDEAGMTLYMFTPDRRNVSNCEGPCLVAWPPFMLKAGESLDDVALPANMRRSLLGVAMRFDGSRQVTYSGWPLYYWARDKVAGDVTGQWVGGVWFVLNADGVPNTVRL